MENLEKVINGLKCKLGLLEEHNCGECIYSWLNGEGQWECSPLSIADDALALLEAQKPHMLSLREWNEWKRLPLNERNPIFFRDSEGNEAWINPDDQLVIHGISDFGYGSLFSFWTSRPTDE